MVALDSVASNFWEYSAGTMMPRVRSPPGEKTITCSPTVGADQVRVLPARRVAHFCHSVVSVCPRRTRALASLTSAMVARRIRFYSKRRGRTGWRSCNACCRSPRADARGGGLIRTLATILRLYARILVHSASLLCYFGYSSSYSCGRTQ